MALGLQHFTGVQHHYSPRPQPPHHRPCHRLGALDRDWVLDRYEDRLAVSDNVNMDLNGKVDGVPTNPMVSPLLTDLYQFTMAYAYWKARKHLNRAIEGS